MSLTPAIIVDLDGTLISNEHRPPTLYAKPTGGTDWDKWLADSVGDQPAQWCVDLVMAMSNTHRIVFLTGRRESNARDVTRQWLATHMPHLTDYDLIMRGESDFREAPEVKRDALLTKILPHFDVAFAIDDLADNCSVFRALGITALQCADR